MASITSPAKGLGGDDGSALRFERASPADRRRALGQLLTGQPVEHDPAIEQFLEYTQDQSLDLRELWVARQGAAIVAASLLVPSPGRTAMLFVSPVRSRGLIQAHAALLEAVCAQQDPASLRLVQSLLDPFQTFESQALIAASFQPLAVLVYMQRAADPMVKIGDDVDGVRVLHWAPEHRPLFARAIERSYIDSRDCPALLGVREIDDVLEGHLATGRFDPRLWWLYLHGDDPVGVMLLTEIPQRRSIELVYLGLSPEWRGRGWGRRMMHRGIDAAARRGAASLILAVDEQNAPALSLYRGLGFRPTARKTAMIRVLS